MNSSDARTPVIVVLGQGEANEVSESSKIRIRRAIEHALSLRIALGMGNNDPQTPVLLFAAGVGSVHSEVTLAERMVAYATQVREEMELPPTVFRMVQNASNPEVWGTRMEVKWSYSNTRVKGAPMIFFVTNAVHARRVARIARSYEIEHSLVISADKRPPRLHEFLAHMKLVFIACFGDRFIEPLRRKYWRSP